MVALKLILLDLLSPAQNVANDVLSRLSSSEQLDLLHSIRGHRLGPLLRFTLNNHHPNVIIPEGIKVAIDADSKRAAFKSLHAQQSLITVHRILSKYGIPYIALKGAYLAFHAYPHACLRPLRDLDFLVPRDRNLEAYDILQKNGFQRKEEHLGNPEIVLDALHHLPPLYDPIAKFSIEIHNRLTHIDEINLSTAEDQGFWEDLLQRTIGNDLVNFGSPEFMLLHLIHHSAYHHRFDNGPLILSDVAFLLKRHTIDWSKFWHMSNIDNLTPGCILVLKLVKRYWPQSQVAWPMHSFEEPNDEILEDAAISLLHDYAYPGANIATKSSSTGALGKLLLDKLFPTKQFICTHYPVSPNSLKVYFFYPINLWRLIRNRLPAILKSSTFINKQDVARIKRLNQWLQIT